MADASIEQFDGLHQETLSDFILVRTDEIDEGDRLRAIDSVWAEALGDLMARDGQQTPIQVCRLPGRNRWTLVVGAHRVNGARHVGIEYLKAEVVSAERDSRRLREVIENLWRRDLDPLDRAAFLAELVALKRARAGLDVAAQRSAKVNARWKQDIDSEADQMLETISSTYGWSDEVGQQLGFTGRTVRNDLLLYRRLAPSLVAQLREARHPLARNATQLRALAKLEEGKQRRLVEQLLNSPSGTFKNALDRMTGKVAVDADAKRLSAFAGAFSRMGLAEKKGALAHLAGMLPAGFVLTEGVQPQRTATFPAQHVQYRDEALEAIDAVRELIGGLLEDEVVPGERGGDLDRANMKLGIARLTIAGNGFELGGDA